MSSELSRQNWVMLAVTTPFIAGLTHLALNTVYSVASVSPATSETRDVSFKIFFDERVNFPQTIRQSTIERLLGPEYEIVPRYHTVALPAAKTGEDGDIRDCRIQHHGGLLTLRVPQEASSNEIAGRLEQLHRVKNVAIHMK